MAQSLDGFRTENLHRVGSQRDPVGTAVAGRPGGPHSLQYRQWGVSRGCRSSMMSSRTRSGEVQKVKLTQ